MSYIQWSQRLPKIKKSKNIPHFGYSVGKGTLSYMLLLWAWYWHNFPGGQFDNFDDMSMKNAMKLLTQKCHCYEIFL